MTSSMRDMARLSVKQKLPRRRRYVPEWLVDVGSFIVLAIIFVGLAMVP